MSRCSSSSCPPAAITPSCCSYPAAGRVPPAAAAAGALPACASASARASIWSGRRVSVRRDVRRRGRRCGWHVRSPALRAAAAPPGHTGAEPPTADVLAGGGHVRGGGRLPGVHRVPGAVLPLLPHGGTTLHPAAEAHYYDSAERVRGRRSVRGSRADAAAARAPAGAALPRAPRCAPAAPSLVALTVA